MVLIYQPPNAHDIICAEFEDFAKQRNMAAAAMKKI
jgi:hypothetical protein